jgi:glycosyltransferase involved in cell wall biosynthesis
MNVVSIITPAFNSEKYIAEAIESVLKQTFTDYEMIVVDDGSTDDTKSIVKKYEKLSKVKYLWQENGGPSKARNLGIRASSGRYCAFLDSDDVMNPNRLDMQVRELEADSIYGMAYSDLETFNEKGVVYKSKREFCKPYNGIILDKLLINNFITTSTVMVRRTCFDVVENFDESLMLSEDYKMWLSIAQRFPIRYIELPLIRYRYHQNSLSINKVKSNLSSYKVMMKFWKENSIYKKKKPLLYRICQGEQLAAIGKSLFDIGKKRESLILIKRALKYYPFSVSAIKTLTKLTLRSIAEN